MVGGQRTLWAPIMGLALVVILEMQHREDRGLKGAKSQSETILEHDGEAVSLKGCVCVCLWERCVCVSVCDA